MAFFRAGPPGEPVAGSGNEKQNIPVGRSQFLPLGAVSVGFGRIPEGTETVFPSRGDGWSTLTGSRSCLSVHSAADGHLRGFRVFVFGL